MRNLTSISEYSDWLEENYNSSITKWNLHRQRVEFGKQKLELWQFAPCKLVDGVWVVLEEPTTRWKSNEERWGTSIETDEWKEYQQAKERCLFECVEVNFRKNDNGNTFISFYFSKDNFFCGWFFNGVLDDEDEENTIEDLVKYKPLLTATAQKQLGL